MPFTQADANAIAQLVRQATAPLKARIDQLEANHKQMSWEDELECIPGRRIDFALVGSQDFTASQDGLRGQPITFLISVDGPFILTHRPVAVWKVTTPDSATNFGRWRPVSTYPLPTQQLTTDFIDISYEITDTGPTRGLQNDSVPGVMLSNPDQLEKLPKPTKFEPNSTVLFTPIYEKINFNTSGTATTGGKLVVVLPGYKIITTLGNG